jgi:hypothetical protein
MAALVLVQLCSFLTWSTSAYLYLCESDQDPRPLQFAKLWSLVSHVPCMCAQLLSWSGRPAHRGTYIVYWIGRSTQEYMHTIFPPEKNYVPFIPDRERHIWTYNLSLGIIWMDCKTRYLLLVALWPIATKIWHVRKFSLWHKTSTTIMSKRTISRNQVNTVRDVQT